MIRPELRKKYYGPAWRRQRVLLAERNGWRCSVCGTVCSKWLQLAHIDHDPRISSRVALMCPRDHGRFDAPRSFAIRRRTLAARRGQLWLTPELEFAPVPFALWPRGAIQGRQGELFG